MGAAGTASTSLNHSPMADQAGHLSLDDGSEVSGSAGRQLVSRSVGVWMCVGFEQGPDGGAKRGAVTCS